MYFLERSADVHSVEIAAEQPVNPTRLLASSFVTSLGALAAPAEHLDVCARIAQSVPLYTVRSPSSASARDTAGAVQEHAAG
jgi:hypothetical protein